jgi:hypothetical protein
MIELMQLIYLKNQFGSFKMATLKTLTDLDATAMMAGWFHMAFRTPVIYSYQFQFGTFLPKLAHSHAGWQVYYCFECHIPSSHHRSVIQVCQCFQSCHFKKAKLVFKELTALTQSLCNQITRHLLGAIQV